MAIKPGFSLQKQTENLTDLPLLWHSLIMLTFQWPDYHSHSDPGSSFNCLGHCENFDDDDDGWYIYPEVKIL